jgi:hypothetical protein
MALAAVDAAWSQSTLPRTTAGVQERTTQFGTVNQAPTQQSSNRVDNTDQLMGQIWGLSAEEVQRAKVLLQGPRASFSIANLSPVEALGIHARNDAERRKYAELFAKAVQADVERSVAWNRAYQEAMTRLYGVQPLVDYSKLQRVAAPIGAADAANVPRDLVIDQAPSAKSAPSKASK